MCKKYYPVILAILFSIFQLAYTGAADQNSAQPNPPNAMNVLDNFDDKNMNSMWGSTWVTYNDANDKGNSKAEINIDNHGARNTKYALRFKYQLQRSEQWEWPYCGFTTSFNQPQNLSGYQGIQFAVQSSRPTDKLELSISVIDSLTGQWQPFNYTLTVTNTCQSVAIPFEKLQLAGWWKARNTKYSTVINLSKCTGVTFQKSGAGGETGIFRIDEIGFYTGNPEGKISGAILPPVHSVISGPGEPVNGCNATITVDVNTPFVDPDSHNRGRISANLYGSNWGHWLAEFPPRKWRFPFI
jgi:hypothetical protein